MKRFVSLMLISFCLSCMAVGCGDGKSNKQAPEADLTDEGNLELDMGEQEKMSAEGGGLDEVDPNAP